MTMAKPCIIINRVSSAEQTDGYSLEAQSRNGGEYAASLGLEIKREFTFQESASKATQRKKFDEIVAFSEVDQFIDTPVKHYSSGMYTRLAFAVAAHLDPEILVIDEVLAVGDSAFQQKCLGRMQDVARGGRTVLFVSHNLGAVRTLCQQTIVLERGRLVSAHPTARRSRTNRPRAARMAVVPSGAGAGLPARRGRSGTRSHPPCAAGLRLRAAGLRGGG